MSARVWGRSAISRSPDWQQALTEALQATEGADADLVLLFASAHYRDHYRQMLERLQEALQPRLLAGCSGQGVIGPSSEVEGEPALSLLRLALPGAQVQGLRLTPEALTGGMTAQPGLDPAAVNGWLVLADPFHTDAGALIEHLERAYPGCPIAGGMASGRLDEQAAYLFLDGEVVSDGAIGIAVGGDVRLRTVVSQGAQPIGQPWTVTNASVNLLESIAGRPAYDVLVETIEELPAAERRRAVANLLVGLAIDEYRESHGRGDFLIRNLIGVDRDSGALAIGAFPRPGQTVQFQLRDAGAADAELRALLRDAHTQGSEPAAALLFACNGRGIGLFGVRNHDVQRLEAEFGPLPVAGFFCNGEIGPVGGKTFVHGFTASIVLFEPTEQA